MEKFTGTITDTALKERLLGVLNQKRPIVRFKALVDQSGPYRERWFEFRDEKMIRWVEEQLNWSATIAGNGYKCCRCAGCPCSSSYSLALLSNSGL